MIDYEKWLWKMNFCKKNGISPAENYEWKKANLGFIEMKKNQFNYDLVRELFGYLPENGLDHINQNKVDNRIENLREVSNQCNMRNAGDRKDNTSEIKGVCWNKKAGKWMAYITIDYKKINLGYYQSKLNAAIARHNAEVKYNFATCNTFDSSAYKYIMENQ